ncbi:DTNBP1 [Bugula neritina]|uniref:DTNBP1 n=1 Tax=Bugula neritina TaxID=10212 RepID=A0A7J7JF79_BUGNE|nr:DTNBP1 [Bugula neritina]
MMLKSFRAKLVAVKDEVTASLKSVTDGLSDKKVLDEPTISVTASKYGDSSDTRDQVVVEEHNDAAQDLLNRYENTWEELYTVTQTNIGKSKNIVKDFYSIQAATSAMGDNVKDFEAEVAQLPLVLSTIQTITNQIVDLHSQCALIENSLATLNNLCEEADLEKAKQSEINKLNAYDYQKKKQLEAYSANLAKEHRKKIISLELREAEVRREKELFYQKAFEEDMQRFKMEQHNKQSSTTLAQVTLPTNMEDAEKLEEFLNDKGDTTQVESVEGTSRSEDTQGNEASDTDQSGRHSDVSSDGLEWDENADTIDILEDSLEKEINSIVEQGNGLQLGTSADSDRTMVNGQLDEDAGVHYD